MNTNILKGWYEKNRPGVISIICLIIISVNLLYGLRLLAVDSSITGVAIRRLNDFTAVYVQEGATVVLIQRHAKHRCITLGPEALGTVIRFTRNCVLCRTVCEHDNGTLSLRLSLRSTLNIPNFNACAVPESCYWFGFKFNCSDLLGISNLVTL